MPYLFLSKIFFRKKNRILFFFFFFFFIVCLEKWWRGPKPLWNPWKGMVAQLEQAGVGKTKWEIYLIQVPANIRFMWTYSLAKLSGIRIKNKGNTSLTSFFLSVGWPGSIGGAID
jgi:hypothetical protein